MIGFKEGLLKMGGDRREGNAKKQEIKKEGMGGGKV